MATRIMAGRSTDRPGDWAGFDGEQQRKVGEIFMWYDKKLPSWARTWDEKRQQWVDVKPASKGGATPAVRRAHPDTVPGQAPKRRIHQLEVDEGVAEDAEPTEAPPVGGATVSAGRAADRVLE